MENIIAGVWMVFAAVLYIYFNWPKRKPVDLEKEYSINVHLDRVCRNKTKRKFQSKISCIGCGAIDRISYGYSSVSICEYCGREEREHERQIHYVAPLRRNY